MGLEAGVGAMSLGSKSEGRGGEEGRRRRRRKKAPICVKEQVINPFGAAALLPFKFYHNLLRQGMGTADHVMRLFLKCHLKKSSLSILNFSSFSKTALLP